ncbi:MAG: Sua5 YciO YrdC YwlC family protein [Sulfurovaceae bacterium]|nr:Sua5 YciO YrdC YwlC family protein [Sulfurovaceae bacterium]
MLKDKVFLTSTDTTIGFVSQNSDKLNEIKQRPKEKKFIKAVNSLDTLKSMTRVPDMHKKMVRRAQKSTFIMKGESFRVINDEHHLLLLDRLQWAYTTSANLSGKEYDEIFAVQNADIVIYPLDPKNTKASQIFKLGTKKIKRLRA